MRDIACAGYVAGCNTQFFTKGTDGAHSLSNGQNNIMRRLSFADDVGGSYASMLAFPAHAKQFESGHLDTVMCVARALALAPPAAPEPRPRCAGALPRAFCPGK